MADEGAGAGRLVVGPLARLEHPTLGSASRRADGPRQPPSSPRRACSGRLCPRNAAHANDLAVKAPMPRMSTRVSSIEVDGHSLRVAIRHGRGEGKPLVLLNGLGANLEIFQPFVDALGDIASIRID